MHTRHTPETPGGWLAASGILLIAALLMHPPPETETAAFMDLIAAEGDTWVLAHWLAAAALATFAVTGLVALTNTGGPLVRGAWALVTVGALATMVTAVSEATVVSQAARDGDLDTFAAWDSFAGGMTLGFAVLAIGVAIISSHEARKAGSAVPGWTAWVAAVLAIVSSVAWIAAMGLGVARAAPVWLVTSLLMAAWLVWYGIALVRVQGTRVQEGAVHA